MRDAKLGELESIVALFQREDKENEADNVQAVGKESMMNSKRQQKVVDKDDGLEVINDTLALQKIDGCCQKVPVE